MISDTLYFIASGLLVAGILTGIAFMSKVKTAVMGNRLSAVCMAIAIIVTLFRYDLVSINFVIIIIPLAIGSAIALYWGMRIKMIAMPQTVALLNGYGGAASALVGATTLLEGMGPVRGLTSLTLWFSIATAGLAVAVGLLTFTGSVVAAWKLSGRLNQKPVVWKGHQAITTLAIVLSLIFVALTLYSGIPIWITVCACAITSGFFGVAFAIRIGGADMPVTISLLNSFSGVAGSIAGMAIGDPLLVAVGGIVGASGLLLTQIMCRAMNRSLPDILLGRTTVLAAPGASSGEKVQAGNLPQAGSEVEPKIDAAAVLRAAKRVIIIPGYGMAVAQAQAAVKELADKLEAKGALVDFAIHPVAGRMPGHMNVLLAEVDVPYEKLREMDDINPDFAACDVAIVVGANDVVNPAAREAEGTPIYGMPVLSVNEARNIIICNRSNRPGYAGVVNPLYSSPNAAVFLGDAEKSVRGLIAFLEE